MSDCLVVGTLEQKLGNLGYSGLRSLLSSSVAFNCEFGDLTTASLWCAINISDLINT